MIDQIVDILSWVFLVGGSVFTLIGVFGMLRLPDMFTRMHAASIIDTMGIFSILFGLALQAGWTLVTVKLFFIAAFVFFTSPTATHALAQAALWGGLRPMSVDSAHKGEDR